MTPMVVLPYDSETMVLCVLTGNLQRVEAPLQEMYVNPLRVQEGITVFQISPYRKAEDDSGNGVLTWLFEANVKIEGVDEGCGRTYILRLLQNPGNPPSSEWNLRVSMQSKILADFNLAKYQSGNCLVHTPNLKERRSAWDFLKDPLVG